jgi:hypothetical protein
MMDASTALTVAMVAMMVVMFGGMVLGAGWGIRRQRRRRRVDTTAREAIDASTPGYARVREAMPRRSGAGRRSRDGRRDHRQLLRREGR